MSTHGPQEASTRRRQLLLTAMLQAKCPDGGHDGFPSKRVCERLADAILAADPTPAGANLPAGELEALRVLPDEMREYADGWAYAGRNGLELANFLTESADLLERALTNAPATSSDPGAPGPALCGVENPDYPGQYRCSFLAGHGPVTGGDPGDEHTYDHGNPDQGAWWSVTAPTAVTPAPLALRGRVRALLVEADARFHRDPLDGAADHLADLIDDLRAALDDTTDRTETAGDQA